VGGGGMGCLDFASSYYDRIEQPNGVRLGLCSQVVSQKHGPGAFDQILNDSFPTASQSWPATGAHFDIM
jgi:hypothetical protein